MYQILWYKNNNRVIYILLIVLFEYQLKTLTVFASILKRVQAFTQLHNSCANYTQVGIGMIIHVEASRKTSEQVMLFTSGNIAPFLAEFIDMRRQV